MTAPLSELQIELIRASYASMAPHAERLADEIYRAVFEHASELRATLAEDLDEQKRRMVETTELVVSRAHDLLSIDGVLMEMGARHLAYGARPGHYPVVRDIMLSAMDALGAESWTNEIEEAWTELLNAVAGLMLEGAERAGGARRAAA